MRLNETLISLHVPVLYGDAKREMRSLLPFVFPGWKKGIEILVAFCSPEMEEGK